MTVEVAHWADEQPQATITDLATEANTEADSELNADRPVPAPLADLPAQLLAFHAPDAVTLPTNNTTDDTIL